MLNLHCAPSALFVRFLLNFFLTFVARNYIDWYFIFIEIPT